MMLNVSRLLAWITLAGLSLSACGDNGAPAVQATAGIPGSMAGQPSVPASMQANSAPSAGSSNPAAAGAMASPSAGSHAAGQAGAPLAGSGAAGIAAAGSGGPVAGAAGSTAGSMSPEPRAGAPGTAMMGTFPNVTDFKAAGPFTPMQLTAHAGYVTFYPKELGQNGVKHPIVSWGPGAVENASNFLQLLKHLASHGFAVISFDGTPQGMELVTAIDWMLAQNERSDSMFHQKLDTTKIAAGGHSAGSLATFVIGGDKRLSTTLHISGGTFAPHTDIENLHAPTLFICGEPGGDGLLVGDIANPNCEIDFMNATVPVFYGITKGASHMTPTDIGDAAIRTHQLGAMVGWLRWQLTGDTNAKALFAGDMCMLCKDAAWSTAKQKNLD